MAQPPSHGCFQPACAEAEALLDIPLLHARMSKILPQMDAYLTTPFTETALLVERLRIAGFPISIESRAFSPSSGEYTQVLGIRMQDRLFSARACDPWKEYEEWHGRHHDRPIRWLANNPISPEDGELAMRQARDEYLQYRAATDIAIQEAMSQAEGHLLDANTVEATRQGDKARL